MKSPFSKSEEFLFRHMGKISILVPLAFVSLLYLALTLTAKEMENECGGVAKCIGKEFGGAISDFKEGMKDGKRKRERQQEDQ